MWLLLSELTSRLQLHWKSVDADPTKDPSSSPSSSREFRVAFTDDLPFQVLILYYYYGFKINWFVGVFCPDRCPLRE